MNAAETRQHTIKIDHTCHTAINPHITLPTNNSLLPTAVANNQPPCITPWNLTGDTFDTKERPIGLKNNSAKVKIK